MRGLDTNVLVRYITADDPDRLIAATGLIERAEQRGERLYVNAVVLVELAWVLRGSRYRFTRADIGETIERLLETPLFELADRDQVVAAVAEYRTGAADFADCLIGRLNRAAGCERTVTFDTHLADSERFEVLAVGDRST